MLADLTTKTLTYRIFDSAIRTTLEFPELKHTESAAGDFIFELSESPLQSDPLIWIHHWYQSSDKARPTYSIGQLAGGYLFRFTGLADFRITTSAKSIVCITVAGTSMNTVRHLLLDHVLPRVLSRKDELVVHASAVQSGHGDGLAFLGDSGWGKSTLAQSFAGSEAMLWGDDSLKLRVQRDKLIGIPSYYGCRLWSDSIDALFPTGTETQTMDDNISKQRVVNKVSGYFESVHLSSLFFLTDPELECNNSIRIAKISGTEAMMTFVKRSFLLDVGSKDAASDQFRTIQRILETRPNLYSLSFPRRYELLPQVRQNILSVVQNGL